MDSPRIEEFIATAQAILDALPPEAKLVPWVIGSTDRDLMGNARASETHKKAEAFDMSPCYSQTELVPLDKRISGMAWNIVSLMLIWGAKDVCLFCVEGDHLHVMPGRDPWDALFCVPTVASWYPMADSLSTMGAADILNKLFTFQPVEWFPATAAEGDTFMTMFAASKE
jgi:hypothetical protein